MAGKFPITRAPERLGVTPTTAVRAGLDVSAVMPPATLPTGAGAIGEAIAGIGGAIFDLGVKWDLINAKTQLGESSVAASDAINKYFLELEGNNDPETYGERLNQLFEELTTLAPTNRTAAGIYNKNLARQQLTLSKQTRTAARKKIESKAKAADFLLLQTDDFVAYKASIINGVKLDVYTAKEGQALLDDADKERDKKEKNDTLDMALTQRDEEGVLIVDKANEIVNGSDILNADEKIDLLNQITNRANQEKNQRDIQFRNRMGEEAERLGKLLIDGELIEQEMDEIDLDGIGEQKSQEEEFKRKWKKILRDTVTRLEPLVSDNNVYDSLVVGSELVERGAKSPAEWETEFAEANAAGLLTEKDRRDLRSKDIIATKTMQNRTFNDAKTGTLRPRLVEIRQGELAGLMEAREFALKDKDFKAADALNFNIKKAQVQEWNFGRAYRELRSQIAQNPEWSQKQIFVAGDIIADDSDKDLSVLMEEFDKANPQDAILSTPPDDEFQDIWKDLSQDDRAKVWEARMLGASVREILGELPE